MHEPATNECHLGPRPAQHTALEAVLAGPAEPELHLAVDSLHGWQRYGVTPTAYRIAAEYQPHVADATYPEAHRGPEYTTEESNNAWNAAQQQQQHGLACSQVTITVTVTDAGRHGQ